jgi:hypothetical protein
MQLIFAIALMLFVQPDPLADRPRPVVTLSYAQAVESVDRGSIVLLAVGVTVPDRVSGCLLASVPKLPGIEPGVYVCWRSPAGINTFAKLTGEPTPPAVAHVLDHNRVPRPKELAGIAALAIETRSIPGLPSSWSPQGPCPGGICPLPTRSRIR